MASKRYEIIRIRFTDGQTVYIWPILKSSQTVAVRILTAGGYTILDQKEKTMWDECYPPDNWDEIFDNPYCGEGTDYDFYEDELDEYRDELDEL